MTVTVSDDFSVDTSANYGGNISISTVAGELSFTGGGIGTHDTAIPGTGAYWMSMVMEDVPGGGASNAGVCFGADVDGDGPLLILTTGANSSVNMDWMTYYTTYTTYTSQPDEDLGDQLIAENISAVGWTLGITVDPATNVISFWADPGTQEPTAAGTWNGAGPDTTIDLDVDAANHALQGRHVGPGNWGSNACVISQLEFGEIGTAATGLGGSPVGRKSLLRGLTG